MTLAGPFFFWMVKRGATYLAAALLGALIFIFASLLIARPVVASAFIGIGFSLILMMRPRNDDYSEALMAVPTDILPEAMAATSLRPEARASHELRELRLRVEEGLAAQRIVRDAIEELGPAGILPPYERARFYGTRFNREAEAQIEAIRAMAARIAELEKALARK